MDNHYIKSDDEWKKALTPERYNVLRKKATERPFTGIYWDTHDAGMYRCAGCGAELFSSGSKFDAGCGWPSFDDALPEAIIRTPDADGMRVEITCARCGGHLGHVFEGEKMTPKNTRYCVNSAALKFMPKER